VVGSCPVECVNCPSSSRGTGESSKRMQSAREGSHSFECIPGPIFRIARSAGPAFLETVDAARRFVGTSRDVIHRVYHAGFRRVKTKLWLPNYEKPRSILWPKLDRRITAMHASYRSTSYTS
jgi:hypothetical protein